MGRNGGGVWRWLDIGVPVLVIALHLVTGHVGAPPVAKPTVEEPRPTKAPSRLPRDRISQLFWLDERITCELHRVPLIETVIPIQGGYMQLFSEFDEVMALFPNAWNVVGEEVHSSDDTEARVRYCPLCRAGKTAWLALHPEWRWGR